MIALVVAMMAPLIPPPTRAPTAASAQPPLSMALTTCDAAAAEIPNWPAIQLAAKVEKKSPATAVAVAARVVTFLKGTEGVDLFWRETVLDM